MVSETVDLVQLMGAGIKDLGGSDDLELEVFFFFPSLDLVLLGTRCASFLPMAQLEELQQGTNLDLSNLQLCWSSILNMSSFGCGDINNKGLQAKEEELTAELKIPLDFGCAHLGFVPSSLGAPVAGG